MYTRMFLNLNENIATCVDFGVNYLTADDAVFHFSESNNVYEIERSFGITIFDSF